VTRTDATSSDALLTDALGSTVALTDAAGTVTTSYTFEPFGATAQTGPASANPFQYTGRENDSTGLYYYRARYLHPGLQRFTSEDPFRFPWAGNIYLYVSNAPFRFTDPLGLCRVDVRFKGLVPGIHHSYIVTTDPSGTQRYYRGGPESGASPNSGTLAGRKSEDGRTAGWGRIVTESGEYVPGTIDWDPGSPPTMNLLDDSSSCESYDAGFEREIRAIQSANIPYHPLSRNSNATGTEILIRNGFAPGPPPVRAPGWGTRLP
jgi:RHS repeat-associated protein